MHVYLCVCVCVCVCVRALCVYFVCTHSGAAYVEPLPGSESKSWARKSIIDLIYIRSILVGFVQNAKKFPEFTVHSRSYSIKNLVSKLGIMSIFLAKKSE